jgi:hypothetical protein
MSEIEIFREKETIGRLMRAKPDPLTGLKLDIWFDYTRKLTNSIKEGDLVAIPNFSADDAYSVCQIIQALPVHFAIPQNLEGYPGFTMEAAKSASQDWIIQEEKSYEDTTKIACQAVPIDLEFKDVPNLTDIDDIPLQQESSIVMPGKEVRLLSTPMLNKIMNISISPQRDNIKIGTILRDKEVNILVDVEDFVKTHFGVFGFTGVGKSNLISTIIRKLLFKKSNIKIVLFDLAGEYTALLIDLLSLTDINSNLVCLGTRTLPDSLVQHASHIVTAPPSRVTLDAAVSSPVAPEPESNLPVDQISQQFLNSILLPRTLDTSDIRDKMKPYITDLIRNHKVKVHRDITRLGLRSFLDAIGEDIHRGLGETRKIEIREYIEKHLSKFLDVELTPQVARNIADIIHLHPHQQDTTKGRLHIIEHHMEKMAREPQISVEPRFSITIPNIISELNTPERRSLYIVISHDPNSVRSFSNGLIRNVYESRRSTGAKTPLVCFIFDEADEFIPDKPSGTYQESTAAVETLARRGRKYCLGVGLATQRVTYLNTSIMAQPHTYFVSRLPRKTDRERAAEAFSMDEDLFQQTFRFRKGDWLIMSHEALGIQGKPIPIAVENAEDRIRNFLDKPHGDYTLNDLDLE